MTELDRQVDEYKQRADRGEEVSRSDAIWLLNELIYERDHKTEPAAADGAGTAPPPDDLNRCALCGWTLAPSAKEGCVRGNCSLRPLPNHFYAPERARAEYAPHLDNDPRAARGRLAQDQEGKA